MESGTESVELEIAVAHPHFLRIEMTGPLGVRIAILTVNEKWTHLYIPRKKELHRLPTVELKNTQSERAEFFLSQFPFQFRPETLIPALLSRIETQGNEGLSCGKIQCLVDKTNKTVVLNQLCKKPQAQTQLAYSWSCHPEHGYPISWNLRETFSGPQSQEYLNFVEYKAWMGAGVSSLPTEMEITLNSVMKVQYYWIEAERWESVDFSLFDHKHNPGTRIKDY